MAMPQVTLKSGKKVKLGRIRPVGAHNVGRFRVLFYKGGEVKIVARFGAHYDGRKDVQAPPASLDYSPKAAAALARMYLNDTLGDCVIAGKYHNLGIWTGNESGTAVQATDTEVDNTYTTVCGPGDQGCVITDVLDYEKATGITAGGKPYKIDNYVAFDWTNQVQTQVGLDLFGAFTIGINLTDDCTNSGPGVLWNFTGSIVGGHDVSGYGYNTQPTAGPNIATWGTIGTTIPWPAFCVNAGNNGGIEEAYFSLSPDWYQNNNLAPNGVDAATLAADLAAIAAGTTPPLPVPPGPTPTPTPPTPVPTPPAPPAPGPLQQIIDELFTAIETSVAQIPLVGTTLEADIAAIQIYFDGFFAANAHYGKLPMMKVAGSIQPVVDALFAAVISWLTTSNPIAAAVVKATQSLVDAWIVANGW